MIFKNRLFIIASFLITNVCFVSVEDALAKDKVSGLVCEYLINPIGIDVEKPRLSWKNISDGTNVIQTAYEIRIANSPENLEKELNLIWSTGKVESDQSVNIEYAGRSLKSTERVYWKVRIWTNDNDASAWSSVAHWEMGMLNNNQWTAEWITMEGEEKSDHALPSHYYRIDFECRKEIKLARVYVSSLGIYQMYLNGKKVGDDLFTPGFTSYDHRIQYQTYDVTDMLDKKNTIGAMVGDGWYRGYLGWEGKRATYGDRLALYTQLEITYTDGSKETIHSNKDWKSSNGPIRIADIYNGERYDARLELDGWSEYGYDDANWNGTSVLNQSNEVLVASNSVPVRAIEEIRPIKIINTPKGELVYDLGQNIVGWARMKVRGKKGDKITLKFAEVLDKDGNFYTTNLRAAEATDTYIVKGDMEEVFEPHFTFHGFRFIKVEGYPGNPSIDNITGIVIHSDMKPTGSFTCSDTLINQLQKNIQWGQKDNFLDIPTDCPQRDERVGWTGDAQVFSMTAAFNFDVAAFYTKWLKDLAADQWPNGIVPNVIPDVWKNRLSGATGWGDAAVIVPWTVYQAYGDKRILREQYASMKAWVEYMRDAAGDDYLWNERRHHWGDWLSFNSDKPGYTGAYTETDLIATAYYSYSASLLSKIALILDKPDDAQQYESLVGKIKEAFTAEYITQNGRLVSHTQTAYALALSFDLIPKDLREKSAAYFAADVQKFKHLTTGFLGTPLLCSTLSDIGRDDLAFMLLNRKEFPSWLYPVTQGATTIWERWDTQKPDGTIIEGMNSFNHYAYGAIGEWLYNHVAGISIDVNQPGYKHILFSPHPGGGLTSATAEIETMYGMAKSAWNMEGNQLNYEVTVPSNTTATVTMPYSKKVIQLGSGTYNFSETVTE